MKWRWVVRVHVIESGRLRGNAAFWRGAGMSAVLRRPTPLEYPVLSFVVEGDDGLVAVDTGLRQGVRIPRAMRRVAPTPVARADDGMAGVMRSRGLDPRDVRLVLLTHLDWDHTGGVGDFPRARVMVHRRELHAARGIAARLRYQARHWPAGFAPEAFDLADGPAGPFGASLALARGLRVVPLPGHTPGQVGLLLEHEGPGPDVLFCADHVLRDDWRAADPGGVGLGQFDPRTARDTSARVDRLLASRDVVLAPSHDDGTWTRLVRAGLAEDVSPPAEGASRPVRRAPGASGRSAPGAAR
jgi:N-acyl homoserine lactone hydrolase